MCADSSNDIEPPSKKSKLDKYVVHHINCCNYSLNIWQQWIKPFSKPRWTRYVHCHNKKYLTCCLQMLGIQEINKGVSLSHEYNYTCHFTRSWSPRNGGQPSGKAKKSGSKKSRPDHDLAKTSSSSKKSKSKKQQANKRPISKTYTNMPIF